MSQGLAVQVLLPLITACQGRNVDSSYSSSLFNCWCSLVVCVDIKDLPGLNFFLSVVLIQLVVDTAGQSGLACMGWALWLLAWVGWCRGPWALASFSAVEWVQLLVGGRLWVRGQGTVYGDLLHWIWAGRSICIGLGSVTEGGYEFLWLIQCIGLAFNALIVEKLLNKFVRFFCL